MEASEKPQLPLDDGSVRAIDDRLVIERLTVADDRAARVVRERAEAGQPPAQTVRDAIEIGARVLDREGLEADVDYVRSAFQQAAGDLHREWGEQARAVVETVQGELERVLAGDGSVLGRTLDGFGEELAEQISRHFDGERATAVQNQVKDVVGKLVEERMQALIRHLSSEDGANPLADFKSGIQTTVVEAVRKLAAEENATREKLDRVQQEVARLTQQAEAKRQLAEAEEAGTRKGRSFEDLAHAAIEEFAQDHDDAAHHVGDATSEAGGKKGDTVVEIGAATGPTLATVVYEAKNRRLSKNDAWIELNAAIAERDAVYGVLVVAGDDKVPSGLEEFTEYQGNKMIAVLDRDEPDRRALELVYRYVRARVLAARATGLEVDAAGVRDAAEEAAARLKAANRIRKSLTGVTNSADRAREELDDMIADVERCLTRIEALVAAADATD